MSVIEQLFLNWVYNPFLSLLRFFVNNKDGFYILLIGFFVFIIFSGKIKIKDEKKNKLLKNLMGFLTVFALILIVLASYFRYAPAISDYLKKYSSSTERNSSSSTKNPSKSESGTKNNSQQNTAPAPTYQAPKQLYYSVSCSGCWAEGCSHNGYSYGGYDAYYYSYYHGLCQTCRCNDFRSQSFWK